MLPARLTTTVFLSAKSKMENSHQKWPARIYGLQLGWKERDNMRYFVQYGKKNHIIAIGTGYGGTEITETEYNEIMAIIQNHPTAEGKGYRLKADLTWEE